MTKIKVDFSNSNGKNILYVFYSFKSYGAFIINKQLILIDILKGQENNKLFYGLLFNKDKLDFKEKEYIKDIGNKDNYSDWLNFLSFTKKINWITFGYIKEFLNLKRYDLVEIYISYYNSSNISNKEFRILEETISLIYLPSENKEIINTLKSNLIRDINNEFSFNQFQLLNNTSFIEELFFEFEKFFNKE